MFFNIFYFGHVSIFNRKPLPNLKIFLNTSILNYGNMRLFRSPMGLYKIKNWSTILAIRICESSLYWTHNLRMPHISMYRSLISMSVFSYAWKSITIYHVQYLGSYLLPYFTQNRHRLSHRNNYNITK